MVYIFKNCGLSLSSLYQSLAPYCSTSLALHYFKSAQCLSFSLFLCLPLSLSCPFLASLLCLFLHFLSLIIITLTLHLFSLYIFVTYICSHHSAPQFHRFGTRSKPTILTLPLFLQQPAFPRFPVSFCGFPFWVSCFSIMEASLKQTPLPELPEASPKPCKKSFVTSLMEVATLRSPSFREDTYFISHLKSSERKALQDLKLKLSTLNPKPDSESDYSPSIWGIPLLSGDERADVILLKFLRARDFKVADSIQMLQKCLAWRKEFEAESITEEDLGFKELEGLVAYMSGFDREGHPVCYNAYGVFKDKEMYERIFGDEEKLKRFLRWRVQVLERGIKLLHFKPGGVNSLIQVTDLKDMPKRELRVASNQILSLFQDNYPELVARKIFINVPWYFSMLYSMFSPFLTQRTKSKFVIAKEGNVAETLYKFIRPEDVPFQYGGLSRPSDLPHGLPKPASEFTVKGGEKVNIQIEGIEAGATITWDIVVGGWDLEYSAEFIPNAEGSYTIAVEKPRKMIGSEEAVHNTFTPKEAGKMVLSVDNTASRKRKVAAYRYVVRKSTTV